MTLLSVVLLLAAGYPLAARDSLPRRVGEAYLLGAALAAGVLFVAPHWTPWLFLLLLVPMIRGRWKTPLSAPHPIDGMTALLIAGYTRFATVAPPWEADYITMWGVKARQFFTAGTFDWRWLEHPYNSFAHVDYPPLVSLVYDYHALLAGEYPPWLGLVTACFGVAAVLVVRGFLAEEIDSKLWRALATLAMTSLLLSQWIGLAEGPLIAYATAGLLYVRQGSVTRGAVFLGLAAMCKNEGVALIVSVAVVLLLQRQWRRVIALWPAALIAAPWLILRRVHHLQTDLTESGATQRAASHLAHFGEIARAIASYHVGHTLLWIGVALGLVVCARELWRGERFLLAVIVIQLGFYVLAYVVTPHDIAWHVRWSWERLVAQLTPVLVYPVLVALTKRSRDCTNVVVQACN